MEHLRSRAVATGGKCTPTRNRLNEAKTVGTGCDRLPIGAHGKEGVDGSSPSEGSAKPVLSAGFSLLREYWRSPRRDLADGLLMDLLARELCAK
jgi:hypothetical protein